MKNNKVISLEQVEPDVRSRFEMVGMHLGPKTRFSHPYSYDPILQYSAKGKPDGSLYSDRLSMWYSSELIKKKMLQHFGSDRDDWDRYKPKDIESFLRDVLDRPTLVLTRIEQHCNVSNGYPVWYFGYIEGAKKELSLDDNVPTHKPKPKLN